MKSDFTTILRLIDDLVKLKSLTLSYEWPLRSSFIQGFEFWLQANNVFTISK